MQLFNWAVYSYNVNKVVRPAAARVPDGGNAIVVDRKDDQIVSYTDLLIPFCLSLVLSMIHSQIVATASSTTHSTDQRQRLMQPKHRRRRERSQKRRKKLRSRNLATVVGEMGTQQQKDMVGGSTVPDAFYNKLCDKNYPSDHDVQQDGEDAKAEVVEEVLSNMLKSKQEHNHREPSIISSILTKSKLISKSKCDDDDGAGELAGHQLIETINLPENSSMKNTELAEPSSALRRRNVNWNSPIKSHMYLSRTLNAGANNGNNEEATYSYLSANLLERNVDSSDPVNGSGSGNNSPRGDNVSDEQHNASYQTNGDDDGFESLNGKSSSGEENAHGGQTARIYPELILNEIENIPQYLRDGGKGGVNVSVIYHFEFESFINQL